MWAEISSIVPGDFPVSWLTERCCSRVCCVQPVVQAEQLNMSSLFLMGSNSRLFPSHWKGWIRSEA